MAPIAGIVDQHLYQYSTLFYFFFLIAIVSLSITVTAHVLHNKTLDLSKSQLLILLVIMTIGSLMRIQFSSFSSEMSSDPWEYRLNAIGFSRGGFFKNHPMGYPFLLYLVFSVFGVSIPAQYGLNILLSILSIGLMFIIGSLLRPNTLVGFLCAMFIACSPIHVFFAGSGHNETFSSFAILVTLSSLLLWRASGCVYSLYLSLLSSLYALLIRPDNLIYPLAILSYLCARYGFSIFLPKHSLAHKACLVSSSILFLYSWSEVSLYYARYSTSLLGSYNLLDLGNMVPNLTGNSGIIFRFNLLLLLAVCISFIPLLKNRNGKTISLLVSWLLVSFAPFLLHLGVFKIRYILQFALPLILLSSIGLDESCRLLKRTLPTRYSMIVLGLLLIGNFVYIMKCELPLQAKNLDDRAAERIVRVYDDVIRTKRDGCLLVTLSSYEYCLIKVHDYDQPAVTANYFLHQMRHANRLFFANIGDREVVFLGSKKVASVRKDHIVNWNDVYLNMKKLESRVIYEDGAVDVFALRKP